MSFDRKEYLRQYRQRHKDNKVCVDCGVQDERTLQGKVRCVKCAERDRQATNENKALLKQLHLCIDCKQQDAYTLIGRVRCAECEAKHVKRTAKSRQQRGIKSNVKIYRDKWRSEGRCTNCGKHKPEFDKYKQCCECRIRQRNYRAEQRRLKYLELDNFPRTPGRCTYCGEPVVEGKKVCAKHYASRLASMAKARENAKEVRSEHPWEKYSKFNMKQPKKGESNNV